MIIEVRKLNAQKQYQGQMSFTYQAPENLVAVPTFSFQGPVQVTCDYVIHEDDCVDVTICVEFTLIGNCSYCTEPASKTVRFSYDALFVPEQSDDDYSYNGIRADITTAVNDAILFGQPSVILCKEDCKGINLQ